MKLIRTIVFAAALGAAALGATGASARIVCNREGECWHVKGGWDYHPSYGLVVHPDNWRFGVSDHFRWREHEGRGYWRGGRWIGW